MGVGVNQNRFQPSPGPRDVSTSCHIFMADRTIQTTAGAKQLLRILNIAPKHVSPIGKKSARYAATRGPKEELTPGMLEN